ncbi:MAG: acyl-CoA dehydratase activase [bacterium]
MIADGERLVAGIDSGSTSTKALVLSRSRRVLGSALLPTGADSREASRRALLEALRQAGASRRAVAFVVATGYGREIAGEADASVTEITCHARGVHFLLPSVRTVLDIGGQDSKAIRIHGQGRVRDFAMNDKCAAGTGRFLEVMSQTLGVPLDEMGRVSLTAGKRVRVSSICTVFAESEVVSLVAKGERAPDILNGLHMAVADRVAALAARVGLQAPAAITGGVARNTGVVKALEERLGTALLIPPEPQLTGCLGAALIALEKWQPEDGFRSAETI